MSWTLTHCATCSDTGYQPDGTWCTCDGRPFAASPSDPGGKPMVGSDERCHIVTRVEHTRGLITDEAIHAETVTAIDELMTWSRSVLGPVIGLGELSYYAEHAALDVVAPRVLGELDALEQQLAGAAEIIRRTRAAALDALGEGEVV